jgi:hypothetical protein
MKPIYPLAAALLLPAPLAHAQDHMHHAMPAEAPAPAQEQAPAADPAPMQDHAGHAMPMDPAMPMDHAMHGGGMFAIPSGATQGSGTSLLPAAEGGMRGHHIAAGEWMVMAMGSALLAYTDQGGPRGDDAAYTGSMAMLMGQRGLGGGGRLQLNAMFSLDPVNGQRGYPNLFASGETAHGEPLVDRQHPHDLFMELSARVDLPLGGGVTGFLYGGPVAEPALGPSAFVHRRSARYLPLSPIGHHWFDSTHVTYGVVTAGLATSVVQLEGSAFRGREPDEHRWDIETPALDSWSLRATLTPSPNWTLQLSHGRLKQPEAMHPGEDERRTTASVHYARPGFAAMLGFAAKDRVPGRTLTAWLAEATWDLTPRHSLFGRVENVANDELFPDHADPLHDRSFRVTRFEGGYAYRVPLGGAAELALGGSLAAYAKPAALDGAYGRNPISGTVFARLALGQ